MITIKAHAECMTNLVPAASVPAEKRFFAFLDARSSPAVLSLSLSGQLNLIIDEDGVPNIVDFGQKIGLDRPVVAFDAKQTPDRKLSIAIAIDLGGGSHELCFVSPVALEELEGKGLPEERIVRSDKSLPFIYEIYVSDFTRTVAGRQMPMVFVAFHPPDSITEESQLGLVNVVNADGALSLEVDRSWKLATNPAAILAVAFGTCRIGQGAFVLYRSSSALKLQFRTFHGNQFQVEPVCPNGATCLATYINPKTGYSVLLVGGDAVTQFTSQQYVSPSSAGTTIISGKVTPGLSGLHASVAEQHVTAWFTTAANSAYSYTADIASMDSGALVPILPEGAGGRLSGLLEVKSFGPSFVLVKTILSADRRGNLTLLQQAPDTRIWRTRPFYASSRTRNLPLHGYTLRFQPIAEDQEGKNCISFCKLRLVSSGYLRAVVNGKLAAISGDGDWFQTGLDGSLTIFSESKDVPSTLVHVVGFQSSTGISKPISIDGSTDPTKNLLSKLRGIRTGRDLLNAKTQTGEYLIPQGTVQDEEADKTVDAIHTLLYQLDEEEKTMRLDAGDIVRARTNVFGDIMDDVWEAFNYVEEKVESAASWVVARVADGLALTIKLAGEVYEFVTKTIDSIKKAISWVLAKVKVGIKKIIEFAGFLFNWNDILQTSDNFVTFFNAGLSFGEDKLASLNRDTKAWIRTLRDATKSLAREDFVDITDDDVKELPSSPKENALHGVPFNWSSYQLSHGGGISLAVIPDGTDGDDKPFSDLSDLFMRELQRLGKFAETISTDLMTMISSTYDSKKLLAEISDQALDLALGLLEDIVDAILGILSNVLSILRKLGSAEIECPIFTALWKRITDGRPFTISGFFSLVLAIPCTILYKLALGVTPPPLKGRLTGDTLTKYVNGEPIPNDSSLSKDLKAFTPATDIVASYIASEISLQFSVIDHLTPSALYQARNARAAPALAGIPSLSSLRESLDGGWLDLLSVIANLPVKENDTDVQPMGVDAISKTFKVMRGRLGLPEDTVKEIAALVSILAASFGAFLKFVIYTEEYLKDGRKKTAFLLLGYQYLDVTLKVGSSAAGCVETFAKDPEFVTGALVTRKTLVVARLIFKVGWFLFDHAYAPD